MNFIQRYLSDKQYIKIIEELCGCEGIAGYVVVLGVAGVLWANQIMPL